ncbi:hypothetical protein [Streptomyces sp. NPDC050263]|uniref:hypothetical protein n=1 Tax=Streptomyces sp. NPDC050263 TaxID=3155037 RepID=UPI0034226646
MSRKLFGFLAVTTALLLGALAAAPPAAAWRLDATIGQPGAVTLPQVSVSDIGFPPLPPTLTFDSAAGPVVQRSPAYAGAQNVVANYSVQRNTGNGADGWVTVTPRRDIVRQIGAGESQVRFPAVFIQPTTGSGNYRIVFEFHWATDMNGYLGSQSWLPNEMSDHACVTTLRPCTVYAGYVEVGAIR